MNVSILIPIREKLKEADKVVRPLHYRVGLNISRKDYAEEID